MPNIKKKKIQLKCYITAGPFRIIGFENKVNVKLQSLGGRKMKQLIHIMRLKKYYTPKRSTEWLEVEDDFDWQKNKERKI